MIKTIRKRPFVRPLILWIAGIILQTLCGVRFLSFGLLPVSVILFFLPQFLSGKRQDDLGYSLRWLWGAIFSCLMLFLSIQMTAYHENRPPPASSGRIREWAADRQRQLLKPLGRLTLTEEERAVLATITLGGKERMPREIKRRFSLTGVAHLLAISGFHVAIVCGFLSFALSFLSGTAVGRWIRYLSMIVLLWTFTIITGLAPSAVRAAIMLSLYLTGRQLRQMVDGYNTLAASAFGMLVYDPFYLFDIGFQLSYIAVAFILFLQPRIEQLIEVKNPLLATPWKWLTVTLSAQTGVALLCLYYFGQASTLFLLTNLPLTLLATLLIPLTLLWALLPEGLYGMAYLQYGIERLTHCMVWFVDQFSRLPGAAVTFRISFTTLLAGYGSLGFLLLYIRYGRRRWLVGSVSLLLAILFVSYLLE
ncbi:MAG: ComEC/Rec2 family competence protein [Tannerellaceae bacterium]|jgi:competence protein ComEC|nr:ComEC/Rec2 family competence protein [Tannerellaceae bacterium]